MFLAYIRILWIKSCLKFGLESTFHLSSTTVASSVDALSSAGSTMSDVAAQADFPVLTSSAALPADYKPLSSSQIQLSVDAFLLSYSEMHVHQLCGF